MNRCARGSVRLLEKLRDRWLNSPTKVRRGSESVRNGDTFFVNDGTSVRSANDEDQRGGQFAKKG